MQLSSYLSSLPLLLCLASYTVGLGINCRGSSACGQPVAGCGDTSDGMRVLQSNLQDAINRGRGGDHWNTGEHITCDGHCCAFYQTNGASGSTQDAYNHITNLVNHGCKQCGSDPTQPGNDVSRGQLTVNYVTNGGPNNCIEYYCK